MKVTSIAAEPHAGKTFDLLALAHNAATLTEYDVLVVLNEDIPAEKVILFTEKVGYYLSVNVKFIKTEDLAKFLETTNHKTTALFIDNIPDVLSTLEFGVGTLVDKINQLTAVLKKRSVSSLTYTARTVPVGES